MDSREHIAGVLKQASGLFTKESPLGIDLRTAALAVESMSDEAFSKHVKNNEGEEPTATEGQQMSNKYASGDKFWSTRAANLVAGGLVKSVTGSDLTMAEPVPAAVLPEAQRPDGKPNPGVQTDGIEAVPAAKLTPEQTTQDDKNHDSKIVEEAAKATKTVKEAALKPDQVPDSKPNPGLQAVGAAPVPAAKLKPAQTPQGDKVHDSKIVEEAAKATRTIKEASDDLPTLETEGVELFANLDDLNGPDLSAQDASLLGSIYK